MEKKKYKDATLSLMWEVDGETEVKYSVFMRLPIEHITGVSLDSDRESLIKSSTFMLMENIINWEKSRKLDDV